jgi:hypothetical protein
MTANALSKLPKPVAEEVYQIIAALRQIPPISLDKATLKSAEINSALAFSFCVPLLTQRDFTTKTQTGRQADS